MMLCQSKIKRLRKLTDKMDDRVPQVFEALSDPGRFKIFQMLTKDQGACATDMARLFKVTVSAISQRMRVLEMTGLVRKKRCGQMTCYEIKKDDPLVKCMMKFLQSSTKNK
ncbi:MAG: winged helix-turn-helix domain-containing protein [Parcubacteria group bacterium]